MGCPSVCMYVNVLLPLVNKEADFSTWLNRIEVGGKTKLNAGRKKAKSGGSHAATFRDRLLH